MILADNTAARQIDEIAMREWGLCSSALVEAAGRECANGLLRAFRHFPGFKTKNPTILLVAGSGNNGADGMVLVKTLILKGFCTSDSCTVVLSKKQSDEKTASESTAPRTQALRTLLAMGVPIAAWQDLAAAERERLFSQADIVIDALSGTGLQGPPTGAVAELILFINEKRIKKTSQYIIAIDVPSGLSDLWDNTVPLVHADLCLAVEPVKLCLFKPVARPLVGTIVPVQGIFPQQLLEQYGQYRLVSYAQLHKNKAAAAPYAVPSQAYKHRRGVVQVFAGAPGTSGAALLAARGAQSGGAGLVQLVTDDRLAEHLLPQAGGILLTCSAWIHAQAQAGSKAPLSPDAVVIGPGLSWNEELQRRLDAINEKQIQNAIGVVIDAEALVPASQKIFSGPTVFTPHPAEFARMIRAFGPLSPDTMLKSEEPLIETLSVDPVPLLRLAAQRTNAVMLLKGHVIYIVAPDSTCYIVDGMEPGLAMGGSGDLLSGFIGALMARMKRNTGSIDPVLCAHWASVLLVKAGQLLSRRRGFTDPGVLADVLGTLAGELWLQKGGVSLL